MKVRLTRECADLINGIDLSKAHAGETLELSDRGAGILLAEGWAEYAGAIQPRDRAHGNATQVAARRSQLKETLASDQVAWWGGDLRHDVLNHPIATRTIEPESLRCRFARSFEQRTPQRPSCP